MSQEKTSDMHVEDYDREAVYEVPETSSKAFKVKPEEVWMQKSKENGTTKPANPSSNSIGIYTCIIVLSSFLILSLILSLILGGGIFFALRKTAELEKRLDWIERKNAPLNEKIFDLETLAHTNRSAELEEEMKSQRKSILHLLLSIETLNATVSALTTQKDFDHLFSSFKNLSAIINAEVQQLYTTTVNKTDFKMLTADVRSLAASSVNLTDFNILSANVSSVDAETKRLAENKASQDDFNLLFSSVTVLNATKASQTELDYLLSDVSLMRVTFQQLSISAVNKTEFHQLTATVSYNVSMINATLQQVKDTTVNQINFQELSTKVTVLQTSKATKTDLSHLSDKVSQLSASSVKNTEFSHYANQLQSLTVTAVSKVYFDRLSTRVDSLTNTAISRTEFSSLDNRVKSIETTVSQSSSTQALANPRILLLILLFVSYAVFLI